MTNKCSTPSWELSNLLRATVVSTIILFAARAAAQDNAAPERFMSRTVRNITPDQAVAYINQTNLGIASRIPNTQTILITSQTEDLEKARTLLELVDSKEQYSVVLLNNNPDLVSLIRQNDLYNLLTDFSVGSFDALPAKNEQPQILVDLLGDSVIVAAPDANLERVLSELENVSRPQNIMEKAEPNHPSLPADISSSSDVNTPKDDQFFNRILESLAQADRVEAELEATHPESIIETTEPKSETQTAGQDSNLESVQPSQPDFGLSGIIELTPQATGPTIKKYSYEPTPTELANEQLELDLPETINIVELIDLVGKYLDLNLLYDPKEITAQVTLRVQDKVKVGELYPLLESVLQFRGYAMTRKDDLVTIVPIARVLEADPLLFDTEQKDVQFGNVIVTRIFDLQYIDTESAQNLLTEMKLGANIQSIPDVSKLIVTDYAYRMNRIEELLSIIDMPGKGKQFRYRQLRYTMASILVDQVEVLAEQLGSVSISVAPSEEEQAPAPDRSRRTRARIRRTPRQTQTDETGQPEVYLDADERTNRILMIGMPEQLDIVETLINSLDVAQQDLRTLRLYDIQYAGADEVVEKLQDLGIISGDRRTTERPGRITRPQQRQQQEAEQAPVATVLTEEGLVEEPQIVTIETTNSLLVKATAEQHAQIATIISYVDAEPQQAATNYIVYPLENQDPEELANVLNQLIQETIEETSAGAQDSKIVKTTRRKIEEEITIIPDPKTYSLVVYAGKKNQQWISSLIEQLDEYRPQVLLDVTLVEITQNEKFEYDLDIISKTYGGPGLKSSQVGSKLENFTSDRYSDIRSTTSATDSVIKAFLNADNVQALLTAIETEGYGRVMARPKLLVNDNQEGEIRTQNTISVAQVKSIVTIPDTGSAVTTKDVSFTDYDAGVTLNIKPHISKGDMLRLEISLNRTDFTLKDPIEITDESGTQTYPSPPDRLSTDVTTVGTVPNGTTIILGGLETIDQSKGQSKVPILGDVPIIGGLFRGVSDSGEQSRLYVFVKANIIRPSDQIAGLEDIRRVSAKNRRAFEEMEERFQGLQDWPGIDPKPMDPVKILDED